MWSSDRRTLLAGFGAALALSGCGFTPAYAPGGSGEKLRGQIQTRDPKDTDEFLFASRVQDRLGGSNASPLELRYRIETRDEGLAITSDQETLRYQLLGKVTFEVVERATGTVLSSGQVNSFTSYSAIGTTVATRASEKDATIRLMSILADQVVTRLLASAGAWST